MSEKAQKANIIFWNTSRKLPKLQDVGPSQHVPKYSKSFSGNGCSPQKLVVIIQFWKMEQQFPRDKMVYKRKKHNQVIQTGELR